MRQVDIPLNRSINKTEVIPYQYLPGSSETKSKCVCWYISPSSLLQYPHSNGSKN